MNPSISTDEKTALPSQFEEREKKWVDRWRQPKGMRAIALALIVFALIAAIDALVYETGGTRYAWLHLMYLPIILAAGGFGIYGGILAALIAGFALGPAMPMNVVAGLDQTPSNWIFRMILFLAVGAFSGFISTFLNRQINRLKETHEGLLQAHEQLKSAQMTLIQTAKLESIGRLAAGVAHEVKNPLAVIQLGVDYLSPAAKESGNRDTIETIQDMGDAVQRADAIIKGLLNFSRSEKLVPALIDLNSLIEESLLLVKHELHKNHIVLEQRLGESLPRVELDKNKVKQVFINVFMNAVQSMGANGTLSVKTFVEKQNVIVKIEDTGAGIPADKLDKMFEPFFTTKGVGSGTGLGLSVSRKIIELHGGKITIGNRTETRGAVVSITVPIPIRS